MTFALTCSVRNITTWLVFVAKIMDRSLFMPRGGGVWWGEGGGLERFITNNNETFSFQQNRNIMTPIAHRAKNTSPPPPPPPSPLTLRYRQPRHNIKKYFDDGTLEVDDGDAISSFPTKFLVERGLITGQEK